MCCAFAGSKETLLNLMTIFHQDPALKPGNKLRWSGLDSAGKSLAVAEAALKHQGLTVFVTESAQQAAIQSRAIKFFANEKDLPVLVFPDWETLPGYPVKVDFHKFQYILIWKSIDLIASIL